MNTFLIQIKPFFAIATLTRLYSELNDDEQNYLLFERGSSKLRISVKIMPWDTESHTDREGACTSLPRIRGGSAETLAGP